MMLLPNRAALYLMGAAGLLAALAPVVANLDGASMAGVVAGVGAIAAVVYKWLDGWQRYEARTDDATGALEASDEFDEAEAGEIPLEVIDAAHAELPEAAKR